MSTTNVEDSRPRWSRAIARTARVLGGGLVALLLAPLLLVTFSGSAYAAEDEERDNYSLYQLASNAATYFSEQNSPETSGVMGPQWHQVTSNPATGGSMLGYADPDFSVGNIVGWFFAEVSGSSQTVRYDTLKAADAGTAGTDTYAGMLDYAHFGAANADLGLDTMSSGIGGQIMSAIGGSTIWILYALALAVGTVFYVVIQVLKLINPFLWFYQAVAGATGDGGGSSGAHQQDLADGMTGGESGGDALGGLQHWIASWYGLLQDIAWQALVPLFVGFLIIGLVLFKKMDRGAAIKKLLVRVIFIGVGLPLIGSMYTSVLERFDDSMLGQHAGPTRVVLSTYVDFDAWMMNDRLGIPRQASISWDGEQARPESMMSVRTSSLAINAQSHGSTFDGIDIGTKTDDAETAWREGTVTVDDSASDDFRAVFATFGMINRYITSTEVTASDFESGIKSSITQLDLDADVKKDWFVTDAYGDPDDFGEDEDPTQHPVIATGGMKGLSSDNPGGTTKTFTTTTTTRGCGFTVVQQEAPAPCNLSPLSAYNYLNTGFGTDSLTMYSSNNATSGFTRENHMAVSQVGTGPAKFMYWSNAAAVLGCIVLLGFWYAIGMLTSAIKRTFSLVAAVPFATLGALQAISKVIVYSAALILEVVVTLFLYQFVSEFLISVPDIMAGPVSSFMDPQGLLGSPALGGIVVVILTLVSTLVIVGVTFALLRVRKSVLQAVDEVVTKLVDKFLDTNTAPKPDRAGMLPALASGIGAGAGMAAGHKLASGFGTGTSKPTPPAGAGPGKGPGATPTGRTPAAAGALPEGQRTLALQRGPEALDGPGGPTDPPPEDGAWSGPGGDGGVPPGGSGPADAPAASGRDDGADRHSGRLQLANGPAGSSRAAKETAQGVSDQGGLSNLGYSSTGRVAGDHSDGAAAKRSGQREAPARRAGSSTGATSSTGQDRSRNNSNATAPTRASRKGTTEPTPSTQFGIGGARHAPRAASRPPTPGTQGLPRRRTQDSPSGEQGPNPGATSKTRAPGPTSGSPRPVGALRPPASAQPSTPRPTSPPRVTGARTARDGSTVNTVRPRAAAPRSQPDSPTPATPETRVSPRSPSAGHQPTKPKTSRTQRPRG
ncbi:hypothetical protein C8K30_1011085 [Promicromonospora sp. AC04]|uniref:hypothetical protein n=1 Tax=Promicromonospora sp. AC04 TaxID=2135723 RepID=UPI000D4765E2|nr:hypothetical protein [Promicromonospora sp. AC04]PUB32559.1 hypothetical protein C8K30_1011085 [Promicromonospora sp. AC04]